MIKVPKSYGRSITAKELPQGLARFLPLAPSATPTSPGLPKELLLETLSIIRKEISRIMTALETVEVTMNGASLLIVYEADWDVAKEGLDYVKEYPNEEDDELDDDEDEDEDEGDEGDEGEIEEDVDNEDEKVIRRPARIKLIDFAQTRFTREQGPDKGALKGLDTLLHLLDGRIREVEAS